MLRILVLFLTLLGLSSVLLAQEETVWIDEVLACDDQVCGFTVMLESALKKLTIDDGYVPAPPEAENLSEAIEAFESGDVDAAIEAYEAVEATGYSNPMVFYSLGLLHEANEDPETALEYYTRAIDAHAFEPMLYFSRGALYSQTEEAELAALDFFMMGVVNESESESLAEAIDSLKAEFPLDTEGAEVWGMYPFYYASVGVGGSYYTDVTTLPRQQVHLLEHDDHLLVLTPNEEDETVYEDLSVLSLTEDGTYQSILRNYWGDPISSQWITLMPVDNFYTGTFAEYVFEGGQEVDFSLLPADEPDPRPELPRCDAGVVNRLEVDKNATPAVHVGTYTVYTEPGAVEGTEVDVIYGTTMTVLEGPECIDSIAWWKVELEGEEYWIPEADAEGQYLVNPAAG